MAFIGFINLNFFLINETTKEIILKTNLVLFFYCVFLINIEIIRALGFTFLSETFRNVFPIPTDILNANPKLSQNKDY